MGAYDDPDQWEFCVEPCGRHFRVFLHAKGSALIYGANKWGWRCWTADGAVAKGRRELARYQEELRQKALGWQQIADALRRDGQ